VKIAEEDYLAHYGTPRRSGRYPWGSDMDGDPGAGAKSFLGQVASLRKQGMSDTDIAKNFDMTTTEFRNLSSIAKNEKRQADVNMAQRLKDQGYGYTAIGNRMGVPESSVRAMLAAGVQDRLNVLNATSGMLKQHVDEKKYVDIGSGTEYQLGVSREKLNAAIKLLEDEGYKRYYVKVPQVSGRGDTTIKVLAKPGVGYAELYKDRENIAQINSFSNDGGRTFDRPMPPLSISSSRVGIRYAEQGGTEADGVIYVRHNVPDVSLGGSPYAQVRIAVDGTHYIKGMAMYKDDMPPGVDLVFNTNKSNTGNKLDALKKMNVVKETGKVDLDNPFSSSIKRQIIETDAKGNKKVTSAMNILNEEGDWTKWSRSLSSQFLSKQSPTLAKEQLNMRYEQQKAELESIKQLTNPAVRRILLEKFADGADASSVHLKAAALPRQGNHVILPMSTLKENEIYAPNFNNGDRVVLIRHPHAGVFEIPELVVNNNHQDSKKALGDAADAVAIHPKVAEKLSGADFDGDTVLVIPNNQGKIKTAPSLQGLKDFDPKKSYPYYEGMKVMTTKQTQTEMGMISNLITDMTIQRAGSADLAAAVRHSMVVIDAEKHKLDFRASARDNGIAALKQKYQEGRGASTLISRAKGETTVLDRRPRTVKNGGPIDRVTGEKKYELTGKNYIDKNGKVVYNSTRGQKLAETSDAHTLLSKDGGTAIEKIYAEHSNSLKTLANQARLELLATQSIPQSASAKKAYVEEVASLDRKLKTALQNAPLERQAQLIANSIINTEKAKDPSMTAPELKKLKSRALMVARSRTNAGKQHIDITQEEWNAIQAGALSNHKLTQILTHSNLDKIKELATPREAKLMTPNKKARAQRMVELGYLQGEIANALGVSVSTLRTSLKGE
jgi:hypothetical protein